MRKLKTETYNEWVERVAQHEQSIARKKINAGEDISVVLEEMSTRLIAKFIYPLINDLKQYSFTEYDASKSLNNYKKNYLSKTQIVADHMNDVD